MYTQLATKLVVTDAKEEFSPAVSMTGDNAVQLDATIFNITATSLTIEIQGGNDQQNWIPLTTNVGLVLGYSAPARTANVAFGYVRLRYAVVGVGTVILAAGINTSFQ